MFFARGETPTIDAIEERIAQWVMMDKNQGEGFQVLYYKVWSACVLSACWLKRFQCWFCSKSTIAFMTCGPSTAGHDQLSKMQVYLCGNSILRTCSVLRFSVTVLPIVLVPHASTPPPAALH